MQNKKKISSKDKFKKNPRKITEKQKALLADHLSELGDLSGVIYCHNAKAFVGGNQRSDIFDGAEIEIMERFETPTKHKTVAHGYILWQGEKYAYREVVFTEAEFRKACIAANNDGGEFDLEILRMDWDFDDLTDWGFEFPVIDLDNDLDNDLGDDDETDTGKDADPQIDRAEELNKKWEVQSGDLWLIGNHRLLCGDSTKPEDVQRLMGGEKAELLFTSPPYADMRDYDNADCSIDKLIKFIPAFFPYCEYQVINLGLKRKDHEIVEYWQDYIQEAKKSGYKFLSWNVWDKQMCGSIGNQSAMFGIEHEWIFVFGKKEKKLNRTVSKKESKDKRTTKKRRQPDGTMKISSSGNAYTHKNLGTVFRNYFELARDVTKYHSAVMPLAFPTEYIKAITNESDIVAEPFLGSGTTMVAAENLKRRCYGIEISPNYCAVILERMLTAFPEIKISKSS